MNKIFHKASLLVGVGSAVVVEVLSKGSWAHAVWAPSLIMLVTRLEKVLGSGWNPKEKHTLLLAVGIGSTIAIQILAGGPWAHMVWASSLSLLFTDLNKATRTLERRPTPRELERP